MRNLSRAIHFRCTIHEQAMEMKSGGLISQLIVDIDDDLIADSRRHYWQRPLIVDADGWSLEGAIRVCSDPGDVEIVGACCRCCFRDKREYKEQHR